jgi:hypothetical protein
MIDTPKPGDLWVGWVIDARKPGGRVGGVGDRRAQTGAWVDGWVGLGGGVDVG